MAWHVVGEKFTPCVGHRCGVDPELFVHLIDEPGVRAKDVLRGGGVAVRHRFQSYSSPLASAVFK